ncbi:MAG: sodium:solute symporter family transporter [Phycisphaerales bacterium]
MDAAGTEAVATGLAVADWAVIGGYLAATLLIALLVRRRASRSGTDFFLAGRSLPWWIAGTSIVATTFSSDTPLQVVRMVRDGGVSENWWWWSMAAGHAASVFLFASLWRRSGMATDVGLIEFRYDGGAARALRVFDGAYQGLLVGGCVVAGVSIGLAKMLSIMLGIPDGTPWQAAAAWGIEIEITTAIVFGLALLTVATSALGGLYGVAFTDLVQFVISMAGAVLLATTVADTFGGVGPMMDAAGRHVPDAAAHFGLLPDASASGAMKFTIAVWFFMAWWARAPGHGATAQRVLATRGERDGVLAMLWFAVAHYALRPWPWIVVAIGSLAVLPPGTVDAEAAYPAMIDRFCGPGVKGLLVAAMLAAFMSTVDTHLNLSGAYLVNDVIDPLRRAVRRGDSRSAGGIVEDDRSPRGGRRDVLLGRLLMLPVLAIVLAVASGIDDILAIYKFLAVIMSGSALVLILRWYWWRVNAWSEIAAMVASVLVGWHVASLDTLAILPGRPDEHFGARVAITLATATATWLAVTFMTRPVGDATLRRFHERVRPPGPGWRRFDGVGPRRSLVEPLLMAAMVTAGLWLAVVGIGEAVLGTATGTRWWGLGLLAAAVPCLLIPWRRVSTGQGAV